MNQAQKAVNIKRETFTFLTGIPIRLALSFDAPVAKIQFPICVCLKIRYPRTPKRIHQKIEIGKSVPDMVRLLPKIEDIIL